MVEVVNRQRLIAMDNRRWQEFAERALTAIGKGEHRATVAFVSNRQIKDLNKRFRGKNKATDVLSFPACPEVFEDRKHLGEIAVSVQRAEVQARENDLTFEEEVAQLLLHGLLHLCGYDHEVDDGQMNRLELRLRQKLGLAQ